MTITLNYLGIFTSTLRLYFIYLSWLHSENFSFGKNVEIMEKDILKLLPQKAFRLISIKETLRVGALLTQSLMDKNSYQKILNNEHMNGSSTISRLR